MSRRDATGGSPGSDSFPASEDPASANGLAVRFYEDICTVTVKVSAAEVAQSSSVLQSDDVNSLPQATGPPSPTGRNSDVASLNSLLGLLLDDDSDAALEEVTQTPYPSPAQSSTPLPPTQDSEAPWFNNLLGHLQDELTEHVQALREAVTGTPQSHDIQRTEAPEHPPLDADAASNASSNGHEPDVVPPETFVSTQRKTQSDRRRERRLGLAKRAKYPLTDTIIIEGYGLRTWMDAMRHREASWNNPDLHKNRHREKPGRKDIRPGVRYRGEPGVVGAVPCATKSPDLAKPAKTSVSVDATVSATHIVAEWQNGHSVSRTIAIRLRNAFRSGQIRVNGHVQDTTQKEEMSSDSVQITSTAKKTLSNIPAGQAQAAAEPLPWVIDPGPPTPLLTRVRRKVLGGRAEPVDYSKSWETQEGWPLSVEEKKLMQIDNLSLAGARGEYVELDRVLLIDRPPEIRDPRVLETIQYTYGKQATKWPLTINLLTIPPSYGGNLPKEAAYMVSLLAKQQVCVKRANLSYTKESFDWSARRRLRWANLEMDGATAFFLICCIRHNVEWCQELLRLYHESIARTIRKYSLLALVGTPPVKRFLSGRQRAFSFDMDFTLVQAHHDILVAHIRNPIHQQRQVLSFTVDDLLYFLGYSEAAWARSLLYTRHTDVAYIGQQFGLVYAALMSAIADTLDDRTQRDADKDAALAALIALTTGSISVGGSFIPVSAAGNLLTDTSNNVGAVLFDRVTARHKLRQQALQLGIHRITTAFNLKVLSAADSGVIPGLDLLSPPSDPDLIPIVVPTINPRVLRPTPNDISVFKASACNVILLTCHGLDIALDGQLLVVGDAPAVQLLQEDTYHHTVERYDPEPALREELALHYPENEIDAWVQLIAEFARQSQYPQIMVWKENYRDNLERKLLQVVNPWSQQLDQLLLHNKHNKPRVKPDPTTPQGRLRVLMDELACLITRRQMKAITPAMIAEQVRYFFIDPPTLIHLKSEGGKVTPWFL